MVWIRTPETALEFSVVKVDPEETVVTTVWAESPAAAPRRRPATETTARKRGRDELFPADIGG